MKLDRPNRLRFSLDHLELHEGTARSEAYSDAIFAIAATLLIVDIKVPRGLTEPNELISALLKLWPSLLSFVLSFVYLGIYWAHHFHVFDFIDRTDHIFFKINILFLLMIAFLPFPTALLGEYLKGPPDVRNIAVFIYCLSLFITATLFFSIWGYAKYRRRLLRSDLDARLIEETTRKYYIGPLGYGLAVIACFVSIDIALLLAAATSIYYMIPFQVMRWEA